MPAGRPAIYNSPEELEEAIQRYFDEREKDGPPITISGMAYYLGFMTRQSIYDYKERPEYSEILQRATLYVESQYENKLSGTTPTGAIFALKNMGWKDKTEVDNNISGGLTWNEVKTYSGPIHDPEQKADPGA